MLPSRPFALSTSQFSFALTRIHQHWHKFFVHINIISSLFNKSFDSSKFPSQWKKALVVPIFKKGDKCCPGNYRPISLLPAISKVLERVVHNKLSDFLRSWLTSNQSGFKKSDGTVPQLVRMTQEWSNAVDEGQYVAAVFFDLKKAFDRVWLASRFIY